MCWISSNGSTRTCRPTGPEEKNTINNFLRNAEAHLGQKADWELAKYALVSWIDEVLIQAPLGVAGMVVQQRSGSRPFPDA